MAYLDVHKAAEQWQMAERRVTLLCRDGKIPGARKEGKLWLIPEGTPKPPDGRTREARLPLSGRANGLKNSETAGTPAGNEKEKKKMAKYFGTDGFRGKAGVGHR